MPSTKVQVTTPTTNRVKVGGNGSGGVGSNGGIIMSMSGTRQGQQIIRSSLLTPTQFKTSQELQTKKSSFRSVVFATNDKIQQFNTNDPVSSITKKKQRRKQKRSSTSSSSSLSSLKRQHDEIDDDDDDDNNDDSDKDVSKRHGEKDYSENKIIQQIIEQKTIGIASDRSEAKYWNDSFGLLGGSISQGTKPMNAKTSMFAHPRAVSVDVASSSIVHQIYFNPSATAPSTTNNNKQNKFVSSNHCTMAVAAGPRVQLYGTTYESTFHKTLSQHSTTASTNNSKNVTITTADKQVPTSGQLALSIAFRNDGRLVAIGTDRGTVRITDCTTRTTILQFGTGQNSTTTTTATGDGYNDYGTSRPVFVAPVPVRSVVWFNDGQHLLSAGDDAILRVWQLPHAKANLGVGGDNINNNDSNVPLVSCIGHGDSIRCAVLWQLPRKNNKQQHFPYKTLAATGSYDHTIRLWDLDIMDDTTNSNTIKRNKDRCVAILEHGAPVETLLWVASGADVVGDSSSSTMVSLPPPVWLVSAGGTTIKVWNPLNGTCVSTIVTQHRKTITCLLAMPRIYHRQSTSGGDRDSLDYRIRIISGGLDGFLRIHSINRDNGRLEHLHGIRVNPTQQEHRTSKTSTTDGGITALAATPSADRIAIGLTSGVVLVRQKGPSITQTKKTTEPRPGTYSFFTRGMNAAPSSNDTVLAATTTTATGQVIKKRKISKYDIALKQFRYGDALDIAFEMRQPQIIISVIEELGKRHALRISLSNRDETTLEPILSFLTRYITNPKYSELLIGVTNTLLRIYGNNTNNDKAGHNATTILGHSDIIDELFEKLRTVVQNECRIQKSIFQILGKLDSIMTAAEMDDRYL